MLARHFSFLLLLLGLSNGFDYKIELDRCYQETACYVPGSCVPGSKSPTELIKEEFIAESTANRKCDVILQIKAITASRFHVMMQVTSDEEAIREGALDLEQGTTTFKCKKGADPTGPTDFKITALGAQIHEEKRVFCSFLIEAEPSTETIKSKFTDAGSSATIKFKLGTEEQAINYAQNDMFAEAEKTITYNPANIDSSPKQEAEYVLFEIEKTHVSLKCEVGKLRIQRTGREPKYPIAMRWVEIEDKNQKRTKSWKVHLAEGTEPDIAEDEQFKAHCEAKFCSLCAPYEPDLDCPGCTAPTPTVKDGCSVMLCKADKWRLEGGVVEGKVECRKDPANSMKSAWFKDNKLAAKMGCSEQFECAKFSNLALDDSVKKVDKTLLPAKVTCADSSFVLRTSTGLSSSSVTCDETTGLYKDDAKIVAKEENLFCSKICSLCEPYEFDAACPGCVTPSEGTANGCSVMECPSDKWRLEGGVIDGKVECKIDPANPLTGTWFIGDKLADKMGCSEKFECVEFSNLTLDKAVKDPKSNNLSCSDTSSILSLSDTVSAPFFTCDETSGLYTHGPDSVPRGGSLYCEQIPEEEEPDETPVIAAISVFGGLFLIAGVVTLVILAMKIKHVVEVDKMKTARAPSESEKTLHENDALPPGPRNLNGGFIMYVPPSSGASSPAATSPGPESGPGSAPMSAPQHSATGHAGDF